MKILQLQEITETKNKIDEYRNDQIEIENAIDYISQKKNDIDTNVQEYLRSYDMTQGEEWEGELETKAEQYQFDVHSAVSICQSDTMQAIEDLRDIISHIDELIKEAVNKITILEEELELVEISR